MANKIDYRLDENGLAHLWQRIKLLVTNNVSSKVDKVDGKGLSTNDYTNAEKTKLAGIAEGAQKNVQPDWSLTSGDGAIKNKPTIPTKVSQLTNDSQYQNVTEVDTAISKMIGTLNMNATDDTGDPGDYYINTITQEEGQVYATRYSFSSKFLSEVEAAYNNGSIVNMTEVKKAISHAVGQITSFEYKIVDSLPVVANGQKGVIYLVAHSGGTTQNIYDEYIFLPAEGSTAARYEKIGTTDIDLTPYAKKTEIPTSVSQLLNDEDYIDSRSSADQVATAVNGLKYTDTAETGKYVSSVSQENGKIKVTRANFADAIPAITETQIDNICTF
jgi:hypothetical protein